MGERVLALILQRTKSLFFMFVLFVVSMGIRLPGPGGARLLASRSQAQSPEVTRWVLTSGAPSRSWDMRELTVHAAMNASGGVEESSAAISPVVVHVLLGLGRNFSSQASAHAPNRMITAT